VLCELTEEKGRSLWAAQLRDAPTVAARLTAAAYFGKSQRPEDREALATALQAEKSWGVQAEIARALGRSGGDTSRDALIGGLKQPDARVRRACAEALSSFRHDAGATAALKAKLREGDASLGVESELLHAYAAVQPPDVVAVLLPYLAKPSRNEVLRNAALRGLGASRDLSALDPLLSSVEKGRPYRVRAAALGALAELARTGNPSDEQRKRIATAVTAALENDGRRVRMAALSALRSLGQSAAVSVPALEAIARHDPDGRVQELAKKAVEAIQANTPAPVELTRLREELDRVRKANEALQERLDRFERKSKKD
jgi:aminopeptidase N